jgi:hypothetical protein
VVRVVRGEWRSLVFYEAAEGGLGVLRRIIEDPGTLALVAQAALTLCHYNPDGSERANGCKQACYECLLSYANQMEAHLLDRRAIRDLLLGLTRCTVRLRVGSQSAKEHLERLLSLTQSEFERRFLKFLDRYNYRLPKEAQKSIGEPHCIADFSYDPNVLVFCDGPHHDTTRQRRIDEQLRRQLLTKGYRVIVIRWDKDLKTQVQNYPEVFGPGGPVG